MLIYILNFVISVAADVTGHLVSKWLDGDKPNNDS